MSPRKQHNRFVAAAVLSTFCFAAAITRDRYMILLGPVDKVKANIRFFTNMFVDYSRSNNDNLFFIVGCGRQELLTDNAAEHIIEPIHIAALFAIRGLRDFCCDSAEKMPKLNAIGGGHYARVRTNTRFQIPKLKDNNHNSTHDGGSSKMTAIGNGAASETKPQTMRRVTAVDIFGNKLSEIVVSASLTLTFMKPHDVPHEPAKRNGTVIPVGTPKQTTTIVPCPKRMVKWPSLDEALKRLQCLHKEKKLAKDLARHHTVFSCGTVVIDDMSVADCTDAEVKKHEIPSHRVPDTSERKRMTKINEEVWHATKNALPGKAGEALRRAYATLFADGYPMPGTDLSDRHFILGTGNICIIIWPNRSPSIYNMCLPPEKRPAFKNGEMLAASHEANIAADMRRYDSIAPYPVAIITPDGEVLRIGNMGETTKKDK